MSPPGSSNFPPKAVGTLGDVNDATLHGDSYGGGAVLDGQLRQNSLDVDLNGLFADTKRCGHGQGQGHGPEGSSVFASRS